MTEDTREPGRMLLCQDPAVDPSVDDLVWPGILGDMTSFPFYDARLRLNISCASTVLETMTTSETGMRSDKLGRALEVENVTNIVVGEDPFPSGVKQNIKLQQQRLFGAVSVCERSKCISNALTPDDIGNPPYVSRMTLRCARSCGRLGLNPCNVCFAQISIARFCLARGPEQFFWVVRAFLLRVLRDGLRLGNCGPPVKRRVQKSTGDPILVADCHVGGAHFCSGVHG